MNDPSLLSAVDLLVLTRLLPAGEKGETKKKIQKDLEPLLAHRWSGSVLTDVLDRTLIKLASKGLVTAPAAPAPSKGRKKAAEPKYTLTPEGHRQGLEQLGSISLGPKTTWAVLKRRICRRRALGQGTLNAASLKALGSEPGFRAALLKTLFDLPLDEPRPGPGDRRARAWKLLGVESTGKFTVAAVQKALVPASTRRSVAASRGREEGGRPAPGPPGRCQAG